MGFMDKAKKLAEQAQQKLDEAQEQFNQGQGARPQSGASRFDEHGRPVTPSAEPGPTADPSAPLPPADDPAAPPPGPAGDKQANATPDPFKPLQ